MKYIFFFVGLGGSNAYTTYEEKPGVGLLCRTYYFSEETGLRTLIAHEFGHVVHHSVTLRMGVLFWLQPNFKKQMNSLLDEQK